jgi:hypothetical protein
MTMMPTKAMLCSAMVVAIAALSGCGKDPVAQEKELQMQLAAANRLIENYKTSKYDGVEDLEQWKKDLESQLDELKK